MRRLEGKVAIITGAAMGQGKEEAKLFAQEGAIVIATDIQAEPLKIIIEEIRANGGEIIGIKHDVSSESDWDRVITETLATYGRLDILVNNAGIAGNSFTMEESTLEEWNRVMAINASSVFLGMKYAVPVMKKSDGGSIINISSVAGIVGSGAGPYSASKGTIRILSKAAAADYAKDNIRVNSVHPGYIDTPMTKELDARNKKFREYFISRTPLKKAGTPKDIANGVLYLASDESSFVTGTELIIDGGYLAK